MRVWYALALDNVQPGWYQLVTKGTDINLDPCPKDQPCKGNTPWFYEIGAAGTGKPCLGSPPSGARDPSFCQNSPDGFMCPSTCPKGQKPVSSVQCVNGDWQKSFKCISSACELPDATNNAGISGANGYPNGIVTSSVGKQCGIFSEDGATCQFSCSVKSSLAVGRLVCEQGVWKKSDPNAGCSKQGADSTWPAPVIKSTESSSDKLRFYWQTADDGKVRSQLISYEFDVQPAGELSCPSFHGGIPPSGGLECLGGAPGASYTIKVRAVNSAGKGAWSQGMMITLDSTTTTATSTETVTTTATSTPTTTETMTTSTVACAGAYKQCGGKDWNGTTCCSSGYTCVASDAWYSQCRPPAPAPPVPAPMPAVGSCGGAYQKCGGKGWSGPTCCTSGYSCVASDEWYSQCRPASRRLSLRGAVSSADVVV